MKGYIQTLVAALLLAPGTGLLAEPAAQSATLAEALASGTPHIGFRYRLESVDQDGIANRATASTLRTRLNYATAPFRGFSGFIELDDVSYLGQDRFNNSRNGKVAYPAVTDPDGTGLNQFYIKYAAAGAALTLGRQRINLDNQRFVGGVGWRQNEQTYDAVSGVFDVAADGHIQYSYLQRISRINGPDAGAPPATFDSNSHLLHYDQDLGTMGKIAAYGYFVDLENAAASSNRTLGARYTHTFTANDWKVPVVLEYAHQNEYADNPVNYSARYWLIEAGLKIATVQISLGNERLGADTTAGVAFATPLATLHAFQGWSDKFLATPARGIDDRYLTVTGKVADTALNLTWHDFESAAGRVQYGSEWDVSAGRKLGEHVNVLLKYASYRADTFATDTSKLWLMVSADF